VGPGIGIGDVPPIEREAARHRDNRVPMLTEPERRALHGTRGNSQFIKGDQMAILGVHIPRPSACKQLLMAIHIRRSVRGDQG